MHLWPPKLDLFTDTWNSSKVQTLILALIWKSFIQMVIFTCSNNSVQTRLAVAVISNFYTSLFVYMSLVRGFAHYSNNQTLESPIKYQLSLISLNVVRAHARFPCEGTKLGIILSSSSFFFLPRTFLPEGVCLGSWNSGSDLIWP